MGAANTIDGFLEPLSRCLDIESAQRVVDFRVDSSVQDRANWLAEGANEGTLSPEELAEYDALINAADFIAILKLKAQGQLDRRR